MFEGVRVIELSRNLLVLGHLIGDGRRDFDYKSRSLVLIDLLFRDSCRICYCAHLLLDCLSNALLLQC
ncbi:MAG TPA: hypothetical protein VKB52_07945, partial [Rhodanobacteraceae bacterium]|nr:hypothetical protein [Rhodanobacteraceae bacterium]